MARAQAITDILIDYLRESGLEKPLLERQVLESWPEVVGPVTARMTAKLEIKDGTLLVRINSSLLRSQLFEIRFTIVDRLNEKVGGKIVKDLRFI